MTFESPETPPALTRRSSRRQNAAVSPAQGSTFLPKAAPIPPAAPVAISSEVAADAPVVGGRRAARLAAQERTAAASAEAPLPGATPAEPRVVADAPAQPMRQPAQPTEPAAAGDDLFARAREALGAHDVPRNEVKAEPVQESAAPAQFTSQRTRRTFVRKVAAAGSTLAVLGLTALLAVSMTLPSEAVAAAQGTRIVQQLGAAEEALAFTEDEIQAFVASEDVQESSLERNVDNFETKSMADLAAEQGIRFSDSLYTNDPNAAIQWPFIVGVPMSSPYGPRRGQMHQGIDLVPGRGAPVQAIADGVVRVASEAGGGYGVHVWIDHEIDGKAVGSHYAHLLYGSLRVEPGQEVKVGDIIGSVGNTGRSYGAHLHFEIEVNGVKVDPVPFMNSYAGTY